MLRALYVPEGPYAYPGGINRRAVAAVLAGIATALAGRLDPALSFLFEGAWFSAALVSFTLYLILMRPYPAPREA